MAGKIAPSILAADFRNLEAEARACEEAGADCLHFDVMDGRFVPNISFGATVIEVTTRAQLADAVKTAKAHEGGPVVIHVQTDPTVHAPDSESWWDVPVSEVSELASTRDAYARYLEQRRNQRHYVSPTEGDA